MMNFKAQENEGQKEVIIDEIKDKFSKTLKSVPAPEQTKGDKKYEKKKIEEEVTNLSNIFKNDPNLFEKTIRLLLYDENNDINTLNLLKYRLEKVKKFLINENGTFNEKNFEKYKENLDSKSIKELKVSIKNFDNFINSKSTIITRKEIPKEETPTSGRSKDIEPRLPENREIKNNF